MGHTRKKERDGVNGHSDKKDLEEGLLGKRGFRDRVPDGILLGIDSGSR